jgi:hypothetical protein
MPMGFGSRSYPQGGGTTTQPSDGDPVWPERWLPIVVFDRCTGDDNGPLALSSDEARVRPWVRPQR